MILAVCARDVKFYDWPTIDFMGAYDDVLGVKSISWCCDGSSLLIVKSKGEPLIAQAPTKSDTRIAVHKCVSLPNNVHTGAFSKTDPNLLAFGMENGDISTMNIESKEIYRYKRLPSGIQILDLSRDDNNLLAGCFDGNIYLYDRTGKPISSFLVPNSCSLSTTLFSNYSDFIAGGSKEGILAVWNTETADLEYSCKVHEARISDIAFLENTVSTVGTDGFLCIFDLRTHDSVSKSNLDGALSSLAYLGNYDLAVGTYSQLRSYDVRNLTTPVRTLLINNNGHIKNIAASLASKDQRQFEIKSSEEVSASGDFSLESNLSSDISGRSKDLSNFQKYQKHNNTSSPPSQLNRTFKQSDVKELEKFVNDYMNYTSAQFSEKMAQAFYAMRINTSKQFICMGEKMDESWHNFIDYLRYAGDSEKASVADSRVTSEKELSNKNSSQKS